MYYTVQGYELDVEDYSYMDFETKEEAMEYFKQHCNDKGTRDWQVLLCDEDGCVIEFIAQKW